MNNSRQVADKLLEGIADLERRITQIEAEAEFEVATITATYKARLAPLLAAKKELDTEIKKTMKSNVSEIFDGADKVALDHGILLHLEKMGVTIPRDALEKIEAAGWDEAIRIVKSIDRDVVKKWPEERLVVIGAKKTLKEVYEYELRAESEERRAKS